MPIDDGDDWWIIGYRRCDNRFEMWATGPLGHRELTDRIAAVLDQGAVALLCRAAPRIADRALLVHQGVPLVDQAGIERIYP